MFQVQHNDKRYDVSFAHNEDFEHYHGKGRTTCTVRVGVSVRVLARTYCSSKDVWRYAKGQKESLRKALDLLRADREMRTAFWDEYFLVHDRLRQSRLGQEAENRQAKKDAVALEKLKRYCVKHSVYFSLTYWGDGKAEVTLGSPVKNETADSCSVVGDTISMATEAVFRAVEELDA